MHYYRILTTLVAISSLVYGRDVAEMTLPEAGARLEQVYNAAAPARDFVRAAIVAKRLDILELCWEKIPFGVIEGRFLDELEKLTDSDFKNRMLLIVLKGSSTNVRYEDDGMRDHWRARQAFASAFLPMIRRTLPDVPLDYESISTREKRLVMARKMEKALGIESENPENAKRVWPPKPGDGSGVPSTFPPQDGTANKPNGSAPLASMDKAGESTPLRGGWALWTGIAVILAAAAGWLWFRSKGKGRKG
jgi:hypothetical protein